MGSRFSVVSVAQTSGTVEVESMETGNFKKFDLSEENIEKLLASGVMLKGDIKIIGRQVLIPEYGWKADLVGLRRDGTLVVIEVKRDREDIERRREPCEMQVIRYAACFSETIRTPADIVDAMYAKFDAKNVELADTEESLKTSAVREELVERILSWLHPNATINHRQELVLVASGFDAGSLLACEWIAKTSHNRIVVNCVQVSPFQGEGDRLLLVVDKVFPIATVQDMAKRSARSSAGGDGTRNSFLTTTEMFDSGLIHAGQTVYLKGTNASAVVVDGVLVREGDRQLRWNQWAKSHKSGSFSLYPYVCVGSPSGKTLHELRTQLPSGE